MHKAIEDVRLDQIDVQILDLLQKDGRMKRNEIADKIGLSLPSTSERLRKLEESRIILGYHAHVDTKRLGKDITAFVVVMVDSSRHFGTFVEHAAAHEDILEVHAVTGQGTHLVKVRTENTASLEKLLARIQSWQGVTQTATSLVLSSQKETTHIRIESHK
jgi:Lrp/AsnC family leucine-responsive transcriptional regulator